MESTSHEEKEIQELLDYMRSINGKIIKVPYYDGQSSTKIKDLIRKKI